MNKQIHYKICVGNTCTQYFCSYL